jgi:hypothetical protein
MTSTAEADSILEPILAKRFIASLLFPECISEDVFGFHHF